MIRKFGSFIIAVLSLFGCLTLTIGCSSTATPTSASASSNLQTAAAVTPPQVTQPNPQSATPGSNPSSSLTISAEETRQLIEKGVSVVLVDVRPFADFKTSHLESALSIPLEAMQERYAEIPGGPQVVVYASCA